MYPNLEAEIAREGLNKKVIAKKIGMKRYGTLIDKLNGNYPLKLEEARAIRKEFFPDLSLDYLFETKVTEKNN